MHQGYALAVSATLLVCACVTSPDRIEPTTVSLEQYIVLNCEQLQSEKNNLIDLISRLRSKIETDLETKERTIAITAPWVSLPELLFRRATVSPEDEAEYARLSGELRAISKALALKKCPQVDVPIPSHAAHPTPSASSAR